MKEIKFIHKEPNEECFEILKSSIIKDQELKKYRIDKDFLIQNLPEKIINEFLDFLGDDPRFRNLRLHMIKSGSLVITCEEYD